MAKRFTDTDKWKREWFTDLDPKAKLVWFYLLDQCDHRGVWFQNFKLLSSQVGFDVSREKFLGWFGDKVQSFDEDKFFLPSFIEFQYGELNEGNNAHKPIIKLLQQLGKEPLASPSAAPPQGLGSPTLGAQDKDKDKVKCIKKEVFKKKNDHPLVEIWNENCGALPKVRSLSKTRLEKAKKSFTEEPDVEFWVAVAQKMAASTFCTGGPDGVGWRADFDFFIRIDKAYKAIEGSYDRDSLRPERPYVVSE